MGYSFVIIFIGMTLLYLGAELLVRSAVQLALDLKLSRLVIGLTIFAFATSAPEVVSSTLGQIYGQSGDIAMGDVLGSNITNMGLVLGIYLLFRPCNVTHTLKWQKMPLLFFVYLLLFLVMLGGVINRIEGAFLFLVLLFYIFLQFYIPPKKAELEEEIEIHKEKKGRRVSRFLQVIGIIASAALLLLGANLMIRGVLQVAAYFGLSERVVAISIIAFGTSLPETATAIVAAFRKEPEIIVGTVIGSNIFNPLFVLPCATIVKPIRFSPQMLFIDFPLMVVFTLLLWVLMVLGKDRLSRLDGGILLFSYLSYILFLYL
ncbi:MAG: Inner membrane protein YrbG [Chlamydiae bacterium]|nr:Inner membrane protein YrbG [Chlamydiota bacterium]